MTELHTPRCHCPECGQRSILATRSIHAVIDINALEDLYFAIRLTARVEGVVTESAVLWEEPDVRLTGGVCGVDLCSLAGPVDFSLAGAQVEVDSLDVACSECGAMMADDKWSVIRASIRPPAADCGSSVDLSRDEIAKRLRKIPIDVLAQHIDEAALVAIETSRVPF